MQKMLVFILAVIAGLPYLHGAQTTPPPPYQEVPPPPYKDVPPPPYEDPLTDAINSGDIKKVGVLLKKMRPENAHAVACAFITAADKAVQNPAKDSYKVAQRFGEYTKLFTLESLSAITQAFKEAATEGNLEKVKIISCFLAHFKEKFDQVITAAFHDAIIIGTPDVKKYLHKTYAPKKLIPSLSSTRGGIYKEPFDSYKQGPGEMLSSSTINGLKSIFTKFNANISDKDIENAIEKIVQQIDAVKSDYQKKSAGLSDEDDIHDLRQERDAQLTELNEKRSFLEEKLLTRFKYEFQNALQAAIKTNDNYTKLETIFKMLEEHANEQERDQSFLLCSQEIFITESFITALDKDFEMAKLLHAHLKPLLSKGWYYSKMHKICVRELLNCLGEKLEQALQAGQSLPYVQLIVDLIDSIKLIVVKDKFASPSQKIETLKSSICSRLMRKNGKVIGYKKTQVQMPAEENADGLPTYEEALKAPSIPSAPPLDLEEEKVVQPPSQPIRQKTEPLVVRVPSRENVVPAALKPYYETLPSVSNVPLPSAPEPEEKPSQKVLVVD